MGDKTRRVPVGLPDGLWAWAEKRAADSGLSLSGYIGRCIENDKRRFERDDERRRARYERARREKQRIATRLIMHPRFVPNTSAPIPHHYLDSDVAFRVQDKQTGEVFIVESLEELLLQEAARGIELAG